MPPLLLPGGFPLLLRCAMVLSHLFICLPVRPERGTSCTESSLGRDLCELMYTEYIIGRAVNEVSVLSETVL